jgi:uncharacterized membrane protein (UPF0127 family)
MPEPTDHTLESGLDKLRGVIGREPAPGERYIFEFDDVEARAVHMLFVTEPLLVRWLAHGEVTQEVILQPWTGHATAPADRVIEIGIQRQTRAHAKEDFRE